jgi:hypothetical protein
MIKTQLTKSEKEGRNVFIQLFNLLRSGAKIRTATVTEEMTNRGGKRFTIYTQDKKNDE